MLFTLISILSGATVAGLLAEMLQIGLHFEGAVIAPKPGRVNPIAGGRRLISGFKDIHLRLFFVFILVFIGALVVNKEVVTAVNCTMGGHCSRAGHLGSFFGFLGAGLGIAAVTDFLYRRNRFFKEQAMSTQEVRDEFKEAEGNPQTKGMQSAFRDELALREVIARVKAAKVIVVERAH